jgi:restriction endonuclease S subunit
MKKYEAYKQSGIEWLGEMPNHWVKLKIGRTFQKIGSGTTPQSGNDLYYESGNINWLNTGDLNDGLIIETNKKITEAALNEFSTLKIYSIDSIVIALYGATIGKLGQLKIEATTNQACCVLSDSEKIINRYLFYFLMSAREYIISKAYGGGQPNISQELIKQLYITAPSIEEQLKITKYLDNQTSIIDELIQQKEKLIELLKEKRQAIINEAVTKGLNPDAKMKNSGIEWLGEVPEVWIIKKLKFLVSLNQNEELTKETTFKIALENIESNTGRYVSSDSENQFEGIGNYFKKGDVLFNKLRPYLAKVYMAENDGYSVGELLVLTPKSELISEFLFFRLISSKFIELVNSNTYGAKMPRASWNFIGNIYFAFPSINDQTIIVDFIKDTSVKLNDLIDKTMTQIEKLKEYRQSIIFEAVTGKIDVRDWQPNNK